MDPARNGSDPPAAAGARDLFDASSDAAAALSRHGVVLAWTRAAEQLLGYPVSEVVGRPATRLAALPGDSARVAAIAERCRAGMGWNGVIPVRPVPGGPARPPLGSPLHTRGEDHLGRAGDPVRPDRPAFRARRARRPGQSARSPSWPRW
ncbi:PAS domain S-box protein [Streptomyces sp. NPDC049915]|uniref:PAS domain S-box protein n=1 Tax=Streptomyces sp. NPDC049915 TaxID=3155510 RepID=UPI0034282110